MNETGDAHTVDPSDVSRGDVEGERADRPAPGLSGPTAGIAQLAEALLSRGQKGSLFTESIIAAGLARDPRRLRRIYRNNQQEIDQYLNEIDTTALAQQTGAQQTAETAGSSAALGFAGGAALSYIIQSITSTDSDG